MNIRSDLATRTDKLVTIKGRTFSVFGRGITTYTFDDVEWLNRADAINVYSSLGFAGIPSERALMITECICAQVKPA